MPKSLPSYQGYAIAAASLAGYQGFSMPQAEFRRRENIGRNLLTSLFKNGEIDSIVVGERSRHVIMESYYAYLGRQMAGTDRDPVEKQRAIEAYRISLERSKGARATALARSAWGPDHGKRGGSPHLANKRTIASRRPSPAGDPPGVV
jgi:hypothetical protein